MAITRQRLSILRTEMQAALEKAGIDDFTFEVGDMRFNSAEVKIKVDAVLKGATTQAEATLNWIIDHNGLVKTNARGETLVGYNARAKKYPFIYESGSKRYKCSLGEAMYKFAKQ